MKLKEINPKYKDLEVYFDKENFSLIEVPQYMKYDFALTMYADRKVIYEDVHEDRKTTEVVLENNEQYRARNKIKY